MMSFGDITTAYRCDNRDGCTDKPCLAASYDERIKELERWIGP